MATCFEYAALSRIKQTSVPLSRPPIGVFAAAATVQAVVCVCDVGGNTMDNRSPNRQALVVV